MQSIAWRDGVEKEEVVSILNSPLIDSHIPDNMKNYQGKNNAGKRVLWAVRKIQEFSRKGMLDDTPGLFGKSEDVKALEEKVEKLEAMLKQAVGGEVSYVESINKQMMLIRFYRSIIDAMGVTIDEEHLRYRKDNTKIWHVPIQR